MCILALMLGFSPVANATLNDRGGGLIYDTDLDITWLQDATYAMTSGYDANMTWAQATTWAENLVYGGYDDWRLPTTVDGPYDFSYDGSTTGGYNITSSEMGYMYYVNLGNLSYYATDGAAPQPGWSSTPNATFTDGNGNTVSFQNLQPNVYWSGTEYSSDPDFAWHFGFYFGSQFEVSKDWSFYAWAVRPGDVVPEPATICLLGLGCLLLGRNRKFNKKQK
jgi:hypothetical protein